MEELSVAALRSIAKWRDPGETTGAASASTSGVDGAQLPPGLVVIESYQRVEDFMTARRASQNNTTSYSGAVGSPREPETVRWFWDVVESMSPEERVLLLRLVPLFHVSPYLKF
jgi:hypothetical protein